MANAVATPTITRKSQNFSTFLIEGTIAIGASPLEYVSGGIALNFLTQTLDPRPGHLPLPGISQHPTFVQIEGIAGYKYEYDYTNKKLIIRRSGAIAAHAHDLLVKGGQAAATTSRIATYATDILGKEAATDLTVLGADSATKGGVISGGSSTAVAMAELTTATAIPAGVSGDTIRFHAEFAKFQ